MPHGELRLGRAAQLAAKGAAVAAVVGVVRLWQPGGPAWTTSQMPLEAPAPARAPGGIDGRTDDPVVERAPAPAPAVKIDLVRTRDLPAVAAPAALPVAALATEALVIEPEAVAPIVFGELAVEGAQSW